MKTAQIVLIIFGVACGLVAMGSWLVLRLGGVTKNEGPTTALIMFGSIVVFGITLTTSSFLRNRTHGVRSIALRSMYLAGVCGVAVLLFFAVVSRGTVFQLGDYDFLLILFACCVFFGRERARA